jgi:hypothetical protein
MRVRHLRQAAEVRRITTARERLNFCGNPASLFCVPGCFDSNEVFESRTITESGMYLDSNRFLVLPTLSVAEASLSTFPFNLKFRPKAASSGGLLWHTLQESHVCRAKLGTAKAGLRLRVKNATAAIRMISVIAYPRAFQ